MANTNVVFAIFQVVFQECCKYLCNPQSNLGDRVIEPHLTEDKRRCQELNNLHKFTWLVSDRIRWPTVESLSN